MGIVDSPSFCVLPWVHLFLSSDGISTLCCQSPTPIVENGEPLTAQTHPLRYLWNSDALKDIRRRMAEGERLPRCVNCWQNERFTGTSYRMDSRARWLDGNPALRAAIEQAEDWTAPADPLYVDLRLGNLCNLKCTICKPIYSSQIERDPVHARWTNSVYDRRPGRFPGSEWWEAEGLLDEIMEMSGNVAMIQLAGGEPTINRTELAWLKRLCDEGRAKDIELVLITNLTTAHQNLLEMLPKFKSVRACLSIDGYGATYEYVRYPARWPTIVRNLARLRTARADIALDIACVLQAINPGSIPDLLAWSLDEDLPVTIEIGRALEHYNDVRILPPAYRAQVRARMEDYLARQHNRDLERLRANV